MDRAERWERAKGDTHGLKDWQRGVVTAIVAGVGSVAALLLFGPEDEGLTEALVIGGSIVGAYILRPLAELGWNYLWAPWRSLNETVSALASKQDQKPKQDPERAGKRSGAITARLEILRRLEGELRAIKKRFADAQANGYAVTLSIDRPFWDEANKSGFRGIRDLQPLYVKLRDWMEELDGLKLYNIPTMGQFDDEDRELLGNAQSIVEDALNAVETDIDHYLALK